MEAILDTSKKFDGQLQFYFSDFSGIDSTIEPYLSQDHHILNSDRVIQAGDAIAKNYSDMKVSDDALKRIRSLTDDSDIKTPSFNPPFELKRFQKRGINVLKNIDNSLIQISPGCGKTVMGIALAALMYDAGVIDKVIVWAPVSIISDWLKSITNFSKLSCNTPSRDEKPDKRKEFYETDDSVVWVLNYERVRTKDYAAIEESLKNKNVLFIYDEVQKLKNRKSQLHKKIKRLSKNVKKQVALTATPIVKSPEDFYNEFRILEPSLFGRVKDFEMMYTIDNGARDYWNDYLGFQNLQHMSLKAGKHVFSADKTQPEISVEFPKKHELLVEYDLSDIERELYNEIFKYGNSLSKLQRAGSLFMMTFIRLCNLPEVLLYEHTYKDTEYGEQYKHIDEICSKYKKYIDKSQHGAKLELVTQKIDEITSAGEKVILFAQHTHNCLFPLKEHLKSFNPLLYTGENTTAEKEEIRNLFKTSKNHNLLMMSDAGQVGLNFQECNYLIHYQTPTSHAAYEQRSDRIHRIDTEYSNVTIYRFKANNTIEERVESTMQGRKKMSQEMGFVNEYEAFGEIKNSDADFFCGFDN